MIKLPLFIKENLFLKNILFVASGNSFGKFLAIIVTPILTRIYSPENFGVLNLFITSVTILGVFSTFRYATAIPIERDNLFSKNLIYLCLLILLLITFSSATIILFFGSDILYLLNATELNKFLWLFPIAILGKGFYEIFLNWSIKEKYFTVLTKSKIYQNINSSLSKLLLGYLGYLNFGLIFGHLLQEISGSLIIFRKYISKNKNLFSDFDFKAIKINVLKYKKFPLFQTWSQLILTFNSNLIVFFILTIYGKATLGFYALAISITSIPINIIGQSVSQVYYGEISSIGTQSMNKIRLLTNSILKKMLMIIVIPLLVIFFYGETIFGFIFGNEWYISGAFASFLVPLIFSKFLVAPIASIFNFLQKQSIQFYLNIAKLSLVISIFSFSYYGSFSIEKTILIYSFCLALFNFFILMIAYRLLR